MLRIFITAALALSPAFLPHARADDLVEFSSKGLPGSEGVTVRLRHPAAWKKVVSDDDRAVAELRGPQGALTGILQIGRGGKRTDMEALCHPGRALTMLQNPRARESGVRITDVVARASDGRPGFDVRYERNDAPFLRVRSRIVCLKDTRLVVSCGATGPARPALGEIEPVCGRVLESLSISEE
jgi:hypothetical protein